MTLVNHRTFALTFLLIPFAALMLLDHFDLVIFAMMWLFELGVLLGFEIKAKVLAESHAGER